MKKIIMSLSILTLLAVSAVGLGSHNKKADFMPPTSPTQVADFMPPTLSSSPIPTTTA